MSTGHSPGNTPSVPRSTPPLSDRRPIYLARSPFSAALRVSFTCFVCLMFLFFLNRSRPKKTPAVDVSASSSSTDRVVTETQSEPTLVDRKFINPNPPEFGKGADTFRDMAQQRDGEPVHTSSPSSSPSTSEPRIVEPSVRVVENSVAELRARVRSRVLGLQDAGENASTALTEIEKAINEWDQQTTKLLGNDAGRRVAKQSELVERFAVLMEQPELDRPTSRWVEVARRRLSILLEPAVLPADDARTLTMLSDELLSDIHKLKHEIVRRNKQLRGDLERLNLLAAAARDTEPGERTLQDALTRRHQLFLKEIEDAKVKGRQQADSKAKSGFEEYGRNQRQAELDAEAKANRQRDVPKSGGRPRVVGAEK